jgi:hypothetical protein
MKSIETMVLPTVSPWLVLGILLGLCLLVVGIACLCHRLVQCPHCGARARYYVGFFSEWHTRARAIGPVLCKRCQARFVFMI